MRTGKARCEEKYRALRERRWAIEIEMKGSMEGALVGPGNEGTVLPWERWHTGETG